MKRSPVLEGRPVHAMCALCGLPSPRPRDPGGPGTARCSRRRTTWRHTTRGRRSTQYPWSYLTHGWPQSPQNVKKMKKICLWKQFYFTFLTLLRPPCSCNFSSRHARSSYFTRGTVSDQGPSEPTRSNDSESDSQASILFNFLHLGSLKSWNSVKFCAAALIHSPPLPFKFCCCRRIPAVWRCLLPFVPSPWCCRRPCCSCGCGCRSRSFCS